MKTFQLQKLIIETDSMTSQHFGSNSFPFRLNQRNRVNRKARVDRNEKTVSYLFPLFFFYISHRHYTFGLKGRLCWIVSHFFFPVEEHYCNAATVNLLRRVRAMTALPSALRVGGSIWTHSSQGCCEVQTISFSIPTYSSYLSFTTLANKQW